MQIYNVLVQLKILYIHSNYEKIINILKSKTRKSKGHTNRFRGIRVSERIHAAVNGHERNLLDN